MMLLFSAVLLVVVPMIGLAMAFVACEGMLWLARQRRGRGES